MGQCFRLLKPTITACSEKDVLFVSLMFDHKNGLKACCVFSPFDCLTSSSFLEHETFCADMSKPFLKKGFTRASERLDNCPTRLCTTTVRNRLHYSVGIIRSKAMFVNDAQKHFCTASAGNVEVLWVAKYRKMTLKKKKGLLCVLTKALPFAEQLHRVMRRMQTGGFSGTYSTICFTVKNRVCYKLPKSV